ncbi:arginine--tRNA ligase [Candidatus Falkowbacteria bacterium]|nr:arginine--tRNA ligase [Candidatus Falkowbacteria bacterium]
MWLKIKKEITGLVKKNFPDLPVSEEDFAFPPNSEFGDLSLPCFNFTKVLPNSPPEIAKELSEKIEPSGIVGKIVAAGPYLNFFLDKRKMASLVLNQILKEKEKYGKSKMGKGKRIMIEFSNANTHKEYHVGHLRNLCYGDAVTRLLAVTGNKAIPVSYINDFGIHVAKTLWAYEKFYKNEKPPENLGYFLGQIYVRSTQELEKDPKAKEEVGVLMAKIESRRGSEYKLWQKTREWSIEQFEKIYKEMGVKFDKVFYESEVIDEGRKIVDELFRKNFLIKSQGAVIADLEKYNLGVLLFLRSDGTALYPVADVPLAIKKFKKYKLDESIYVVDVRQSLYFQQLFKILELLGYKQKMIHLGYEFVKLPSGMMSSRTGNVITYENLWAEATERAIAETKKRHTNWSERQINETAKKIVVGAIKFEMVKVGKEQTITFDIDRSLRFEGFTAAYLQYTHARICSIIRKAGIKISGKIDFDKFQEKWEYNLMVELAKFPEILEKAARTYNPAVLADYLHDLAKIFSDFYRDVKVIDADLEAQKARIALIGAVKIVLAKGLGVLGIAAPEEM